MPGTAASASNPQDSFWTMSRRSNAAELMDGVGLDLAELKQNFRDIRRVNQLLGGTATVMRHLPKLIETVPTNRPVAILDLATGAGDIPVAIVRWARQQRRVVSIVASDSSPEILEIAREETIAFREI